MILKTLLQRLHAALADGPGLNARPHHSRQRLDVTELAHLGGADPALLPAQLLDPRRGAATFPARIPAFESPGGSERDWPEPQRLAKQASDRQSRLLDKLRDIAADAADYFNDHGESALYVGFPLLSLPPVADRSGLPARRILAPVAFIPVHLAVRRGTASGITLEATGSGPDRLIPNPALLAWLEEETGRAPDEAPLEDAAEDPWRELQLLLDLVAKAAELPHPPALSPDSPLQPVPRTAELPATATLLPCAVLGLFPTTNPGLLRDTLWMRDHEASLLPPARTFLTLDPTNPTNPTDQRHPSDPSDRSYPSPPSHPPPSTRFPIAPLRPCLAAAVAHPRAADALVIHGPPGTGKSQTIANIIGDHLARGERVLFVCDKRTALDVVHFRLNALGLGGLCGVIHDAQADRRDFYLHLRSTLDSLAEAPVLPDPAADLDRTNLRLDSLHAELAAAFHHLHAPEHGASFHDLCGEWLRLRDPAVPDLPDIPGLTPASLQGLDADCEELVVRARRAHWPSNPFRDRLALTPSAWQARDPAAWRTFFQQGAELARTLDALPRSPAYSQVAPNPDPANPDWPAQARTRLEAADALARIDRRNDPALAARLASSPAETTARWLREAADLAPSGPALDTPLDRELWPQVRDNPPSLAELRRHKLALQQWAAVAGNWKRWFAFGLRSAAKPILQRLALPPDPASTQRALRFLESLEARWQWSELRAGILGQPANTLSPDPELLALRDGLPEFVQLQAALAQGDASPPATPIFASLASATDRPALVRALTEAARLAEALEPFTRRGQGFLSHQALRAWTLDVIHGSSAAELADAFVSAFDTLDDAVRIQERRNGLPEPVRRALDELLVLDLPWEIARTALRSAALAHAMRRRLADCPGLARIDSARVEAALSELGRLGTEKTSLVRASILHQWQKRWRDRLLASTGSRLNSLGASLRQRLFVRGQRALKLRQMIATGAGTEGGDPLFDLCPVWMASPATVAQVFPREPLFDVVIFDEASQCRLEEALPVLLRARRVVIAGDPRQLPPTRFFESSNLETDEPAAETAEDVFHLQQAEAEDLLSAALNLAVQESFLDVHYRSRDAALIGFSNAAFYGDRLVPLPGHPARRAPHAAIQFHRVDGTYEDRGNEAEARAAVDLVARLLALPKPPSIGIACFNLPQRDLILDAFDERAAADPGFAERLAAARERQGAGSFEGLFVKNLENVQGDERDHMILCTTFGPDAEGRFRRNFGALSRSGGERRLNVLVTRAREAVHVLTSIPRTEYLAAPDPASEATPAGRQLLYAYLRYAEEVSSRAANQPAPGDTRPTATCEVRPTPHPSPVAEAVGRALHARGAGRTTVHWGNAGFCVDVVVEPPPGHPTPENPDTPATLGYLTDFNRYPRSPDPIAWEQFRTQTLKDLGWSLERLWSPSLFREGLDRAPREGLKSR